MGWPLSIIFGDNRKKYKHYLKSSLKKIGNYKPTNWVLIEPNSNYHYGFIDAGLLNFPTYDYDKWFTPMLSGIKIKLDSENVMNLILTEEDGSKNPWARTLGYELCGPLIFNSEFPFGISDIEMLEKI